MTMPTFVENLHQRDKREHPLSSPHPPMKCFYPPPPPPPQQGGGCQSSLPNVTHRQVTRKKKPPVKSYPEPRRLDIYCTVYIGQEMTELYLDQFFILIGTGHA